MQLLTHVPKIIATLNADFKSDALKLLQTLTHRPLGPLIVGSGMDMNGCWFCLQVLDSGVSIASHQVQYSVLDR